MSPSFLDILNCCGPRGERSDGESDSETPRPSKNTHPGPKSGNGNNNNNRDLGDATKMNANLPTPPATVERPDPKKILEQPDGAPSEKFPKKVGDVSFSDIDPGVFNAEMMSENLYVKPDPNNLERTPEYQGGNVTVGTYAGSQAAITQVYDRIERAYESYFDVLQIEPTLPRRMELEERQQIYRWAEDKTYPPHLDTIPKKDDVAQWKIFNALGLVETQLIVNKVIPDSFLGKTKAWIDSKVKAAVGGTPEVGLTIQELVDYNMNNRKSGTDLLMGDNLGHLPDWYTDRRFADQSFTGTNPVTIKKCPPELLREFMAAAKEGGYTNWEKELPKIHPDDFLVQDYSFFRDAFKAKADEELSHAAGPTKDVNWACAAVTLFQLRSDGKLHPIAICCDYKGTMAASVTIFNTRTSPDDKKHDQSKDYPWRYAKTCAMVSDWLMHELVVHLTNSHFVEESVIVATNRTFQPEHVVYQILYPHWYKTLSLNAGARASLVPQVIADIIGLKPEYAFGFVRDSFEKFDFVANYVPNDLAARGFPSTEEGLKDDRYKNYAYARNIVPMWSAIRKYVMSMLLLHYDQDPVQGSSSSSSKPDGSGGVYVKDDAQVQAWCREAQGPGGLPKFPSIRTLDELCDAVTMCIHLAAPFHSTVNYLQNFYQGFVAAKPPSLCSAPPSTLGQLRAYEEKDLVRALPVGRQRQWLLAAQVPWLLSFKVASDRSLINFAQSQWMAKRHAAEGTRDAMVRDISDHFYIDLRTLHLFVAETTRKMDEGSVPYLVMDPGNTAVSILI